MYLRIFALVIFVGVFCPGDINAQWNAIAGYDISNADAGPVNQVLRDFNATYPNTKAFTDIRVLHGFTAGLRYQYRLGAFELAYNRRFTRRIGDVFRIEDPEFEPSPANPKPQLLKTNADFYYEIRTFSYTAEFGGAVRLGASIDYNTYLTEMKYEHVNFTDFKIKQHILGSHLFIGTHIANRSNLSFSIRGYYQFIWEQITSRSLRERLQLLSDDDCSGCDFAPGTFGLSIIINNGPQRR